MHPIRALVVALLATATPALAQSDAVTLRSEVFVLRDVPQPDGTVKREAQAPDRVLPGDPILIRLDYSNIGGTPATDFLAVNPIPEALAFTSTASIADYSVDGGKTWGPLASLTVPKDDGTARPAQAADVTHLRFHAPGAVAAGAKGQFAFNAVVR